MRNTEEYSPCAALIYVCELSILFVFVGYSESLLSGKNSRLYKNQGILTSLITRPPRLCPRNIMGRPFTYMNVSHVEYMLKLCCTFSFRTPFKLSSISVAKLRYCAFQFLAASGLTVVLYPYSRTRASFLSMDKKSRSHIR